MSVALVILVWNERKALEKLWDSIPFDAVDELLVVDPGSTDGTLEFVRSKGAKIYIQKNKGRGNAFIESINQIESNKIVFFSGDGNEDPRDIPKIVSELNKGHDLVIGCRFIRVGSKSDDSDDPLYIRKLGNIFFGLVTRFIWKTGAYDAVNGFRGFNKDAMKKMNLDAPKYEIELQSTIRAGKLGLSIKEIPTLELKRLGGLRKPTASTITLGFKLGLCLLKEIIIGKRCF